MIIENLIETQYISIDNATLRVFVDNVKIFEPLFNLHKFGFIDKEYGDMIEIPDKEKREKYNVPNFITEIVLYEYNSFDNCLLFYVDGGFDIIILHNWIQEFINKQKTYGN